MRVLVCGSRTFSDPLAVYSVLFGLTATVGDDPDFVVIQGGANGADRLAANWADDFGCHSIEVPADWDRHGKAAGPIRNHKMLEHKPDVVWAFVDKPLVASRGTNDMVVRARSAGIPTYVVERVREA